MNLSPYQNEANFSAGLFFPYGSLPGYQIGNSATDISIYPAEGLKPEFVNTKEVGENSAS